MKKAGKIAGLFLTAAMGIAAAAFLILLTVLTVTEYRPADMEKLVPSGSAKKQLQEGDTVHILCWNIGFGALGDNADFFMDGGEKVKPSTKERVEENIAAVTKALSDEAADIILLQEVDEESTHSYYMDERAMIAGGDFNQTLDTVDLSAYPQQGEDLWAPGVIRADAFRHMQCLMDESVPSCRSLDRPYDSEDPLFQYYVIDGYLVSDNLKVEKLETVDLGFVNSDHNPVRLQVTVGLPTLVE